MTTLKFKTSIKCGACIATVTPFLNKAVGENNWSVDIADPAKILTVNTQTASPEVITSALKDAGYTADLLPTQAA